MGQLAEPVIGVEYDTDRKENFSGFVGENSLGLYTADYIYHSRRKQELIIRQFHKGDLQLVSTKDIYSQIEDGYTNEPEELFFQENKFFLFSKLYSERDKTELLALEVFNEFCDKQHQVILDTLENDEIQYIEESQSKKGFILAKHLKYTQLIEQEINLIRINNKGEVAWTKNIKSPMALQSLRIEKMCLKGDSPVYILCNYAFDLSNSGANGNQLVNNQYALWAYDQDKKFLKEFEIRLKSKWVNGIDLKIDNKDNLLVSGYFNETKNPTIAGVFSLRISRELTLLNTSWHKFDDNTISKFMRKDERRRTDELEDFKLKSLAMMDNGTFFLIGEQYYKYVERSYDPRTNITTTTEHYNYNSIIVSYFDSAGKHKWTDRVPKMQNSTNDFGYFSSFALLNSGKDIYLFFNDARKNNEDPPKSYYGYTNLFNNRKFQISYVHIDKNGIVNREGLLDPKYDYMLRAKLSGQLNPETVYLITETNRNSKIVKVSVK
ncbi:MAG: hypothetical protein HUJ25_04300 [Crocinitomicaceae bacterium]|nr:hypothetical protein [Crocinitomicaceae bacterium]